MLCDQTSRVDQAAKNNEKWQAEHFHDKINSKKHNAAQNNNQINKKKTTKGVLSLTTWFAMLCEKEGSRYRKTPIYHSEVTRFELNDRRTDVHTDHILLAQWIIKKLKEKLKATIKDKQSNHTTLKQKIHLESVYLLWAKISETAFKTRQNTQWNLHVSRKWKSWDSGCWDTSKILNMMSNKFCCKK